MRGAPNLNGLFISKGVVRPATNGPDALHSLKADWSRAHDEVAWGCASASQAPRPPHHSSESAGARTAMPLLAMRIFSIGVLPSNIRTNSAGVLTFICGRC